MNRKNTCWIQAIFLLSFLFLTNPVEAMENQKQHWWKDAIFYQIWPASFQDSNGDGIGDLKGLEERLPYLEKLGVNALWLTPIFSSPSYHGYNVTHFQQIDSRYGTNEEFAHLVNTVHKKGMRIILDLVINHVSNQHEWFHAAEKMDPTFSDYFIWKTENELKGTSWHKPWSSEKESTWKDVWHISQTRLDEHRRQYPHMHDADRPIYYYGVFGDIQPDLNFDNQKVTAEIYEAARFWLQMGVDGFRLDGARYLFEETNPDGKPIQADSAKTIQFWNDFATYLKGMRPDFYLVAEAWSTNPIIAKYYTGENGIDAAFDFTLGSEITNSITHILMDQDKGPIYSSLSGSNKLGDALRSDYESKKGTAPLGFYAPFLSNHDQIRIGTQFSRNTSLLKCAASALLTLPGTPYLYYGEEIGMTQPKWHWPHDFFDDIFKRSPMLWDNTKNAGFSSGENIWVDEKKWVPWRPHHHPWWKNYVEEVKSLTPCFSVEAQWEDSNSLLHHYEKLIHLRKERPELRASEDDSIEFLADNGAVALYRRTSKTGSECIVAINPHSCSINVHLPQKDEYTDLVSGGKRLTNDQGEMVVGPFETLVLTV